MLGSAARGCFCGALVLVVAAAVAVRSASDVSSPTGHMKPPAARMVGASSFGATSQWAIRSSLFQTLSDGGVNTAVTAQNGWSSAIDHRLARSIEAAGLRFIETRRRLRSVSDTLALLKRRAYPQALAQPFLGVTKVREIAVVDLPARILSAPLPRTRRPRRPSAADRSADPRRNQQSLTPRGRKPRGRTVPPIPHAPPPTQRRRYCRVVLLLVRRRRPVWV